MSQRAATPGDRRDRHPYLTKTPPRSGREVDELSGTDRETVWVLMPKAAVPPRWAGRAVDLALVPLGPEEARGILQDGSAAPSFDRDDEKLARLVAKGLSADEIARAAHMTPRSVYRHMARLRRKVGARSTSELISHLAREGF
jgi:DNA-binding CsgD family transcriptional regulator